MIFPVPASPPINLVADMIGSRFVIFSWQPPAIPNGIITSYTVTYNLTGETSLVFQTGEQYTIPGLDPYSYYQFTVFASTSLGDGPPTLPITLRTAVASEYLCVSYKWIHPLPPPEASLARKEFSTASRILNPSVFQCLLGTDLYVTVMQANSIFVYFVHIVGYD